MIAGFLIASDYWYEGESKEGYSDKSGIIIICFWTAGVLFLMWTKVLEYKPPYKEFVILIISFEVTGFILESKRLEHIKENSEIVSAKILFSGRKGRKGFGIDYRYEVNTTAYSKWDKNEDFIIKNNLKVGDSIEIVYNKLKPDMHEFKDLYHD